METIVKAQKTYTCEVCGGNIQKGEKHIHIRERRPRYIAVDYDCEEQVGVEYVNCRTHNRDCFPRLLHYSDTVEILKNCNYGKHKPVHDMDPDSYDDTEWCEWCGKIL